MATPKSFAETPAAPGPWSPGKRIAFRFAFASFVAYCFPVPEGLADVPWNPVEDGWHALVPWVGARILHLAAPISVKPTGSGDTTYSFVKLLCAAVLALVATLVWSILDRRRTEYRSLHAWLRVYLRYVLAMIMVAYGLIKVFDLQFPFPDVSRLTQSYGDSSPMGLLWTFMGYAPAYQTFAGAGELLGGALLLFRRTTTLGALIVVGVGSNVVMMNYTYDVPVKLGSSLILLLAVFLLVPDLGRLARFFVLNRPTEPAPAGPVLPRRWQEKARIMLKIAFIGYLVYQHGDGVLESWKKYGPGAPRGPLEGGYEVKAFARKGEDVPPLVTDGTRWRRVFVYSSGFLRVQRMNDTAQFFRYQDDAASATLTLTKAKAGPPGEPAAPVAVFHYTRPDPGALALQGTLEDEAAEIRLETIDPKKIPLVARGFHWIQEYPYNR